MPKRRGRGEGGVEELPSGKWRATAPAGRHDSETGRRRRHRATFDTKKQALDWLAAQRSTRRGEWSGRTLAEWITQWLDAKRPTVAPRTIHGYEEAAVRVRDGLGGERLGELTAVMVQAWAGRMEGAGVTPFERSRSLKTLRSILAEAVRMGQVPVNVAKPVRLPKVEGGAMRCLTVAEAKKILEAAAADRYAALYALALDSGMRPGELFALHWPEVDLETPAVKVEKNLENIDGRRRLKDPKTRSGRRSIAIAPRTAEALRHHRRRMELEGQETTFGPVFPLKGGGLVGVHNFHRDSFRKVLERSGLSGVRPYDLRHTCATLLLSAGVNVKVVAERLGHADISITLRHYAHALPTMQEAAAAAVQNLYADCPTDDPSAPWDLYII